MAQCSATFKNSSDASKWASVAPGRGCGNVSVIGSTVYFTLPDAKVERINAEAARAEAARYSFLSWRLL